MLYTPMLPEVAGGLVDARFATIPLANTLKGEIFYERRHFAA